MNIDWSKAPEGTTGAMVAQFESSLVKAGQVEFVKSEPSECAFWQGPGEWFYVARPLEWNGKGLPPVGTVCEYRSRNSIDATEVKIIAHFPNSGADVAVFVPTWEGPKTVGQAIAECFRALSSTERVEAQKRDKDKGIVATMSSARTGATWNGKGLPPVGTLCEVLYGEASFQECVILAHTKRSGGSVAVYQAGDVIGGYSASLFRPLRADRDKAIAEMMAAAECDTPWDEFGRLYDAGYRKFEIVGDDACQG